MANQSASRKASLDFLDNLGTDRGEFRKVSDGLESVAGEFINRVIDNINSFDLIDKGNISDLAIEVIDDKSLNILGQTYINFIDEGVKGSKDSSRAPNSPYAYSNKMPNPQIFADWIRSKNVKVRNTSYHLGTGNDQVIPVDDDDKTIKRAAYAMARDRFEKGAEPKPIFKKEIPRLVQDAANVVGNITVQDILSNLDL